jgi:hypothetical protein
VVFNNTLVDGHNRYEICTKHDLPFSILEKDFADENHAKEWMILNQFGRRNLINYQRSVLALELEGVFSDRAKENQTLSSGAGVKGCQKSDNLNPIDTKKELAKVANVSHDTIAKVKKIQSIATQEVKDKLKSGEVSINQAYKDIKKVEARVERVNKIVEISQGNQTLEGIGKFPVIYADPPWRYEFAETENREIENH